MTHVARGLLWGLFPLLMMAVGCDRQEETRQATQEPTETRSEAAKPGPRLVVPDEVRGKWRAVKIAVQDKGDNQETVYTVPIGERWPVPGSDLVLEVKTFLPAFIMDGSIMTSASNEPKNPAAQIVIREQGETLFKGWLFSLYPGTHAFQHPRIGFALVDYVPAEKEKG